jgi:uncharacterized damage-inducible protein DinB
MKQFTILLIYFNSLSIVAQGNQSNQILNQLLEQNKLTNGFALNQVNDDNLDMKLNEKANSIGFMYRHIGETMNMFTTFLGETTTVQNTTMMQTDQGQGKNFEESKKLVALGFEKLQEIINKQSDAWWLEEIDTPFFGKVSRLRLFSHVLYHNSHHAGQISMTLSKGN